LQPQKMRKAIAFMCPCG